MLFESLLEFGDVTLVLFELLLHFCEVCKLLHAALGLVLNSCSLCLFFLQLAFQKHDSFVQDFQLLD